MATTYVTANEALITVNLTGVSLPSIYSWTTFQGGDLSASTSALLPGGMQKALALPGPATRSNVTVTAPWSVDFQNIVPSIEAAAGQSRMSASFTSLDSDGNINGDTVTRTGYLKEVQIPSWDSKSGDAVYIGLVMECDA